MRKRLLCIAICVTLCISVLPITARAATQISSVAITNLPRPLAGSQVSVSATVNTTGAQLYSMDWYDQTAGRFLESTDRFVENHIYEVQLWVEAQSGYEFRTSGTSPNVFATVSGKTATVSKAYEYQAWAMIVVSYTFDPCEKREIKSADIRLEGITKSGNVLRVEEGQYVPFSIQSGDEQVMLYPQLHTRYFPYGFHWSNITKDTVAYDGDRFRGGCDYYVTIALKPRDSSFTFADNFTATIGGKSAQIKSLGKTYAEISVEVTCFGNIGGNDIRPVVILPKDGNAPDYGVTYAYPQCKNIDYASVEGWYDVQTGERITSYDTFVGGKQYRVEICCTAAYPYKFDRDANGKMKYSPQITGWDVDSYRFGYDDYRGRELIYITKTFTAETRDHICTAGPWQCDESGHKNYCITCGTALAGGAHWSNEDATCAHGKLCEVCGYEFTEPTEEHTPGTQWTACGDLYHAHLCTLCGAHCDPEDHEAGPAGTPDAAEVCKDCGYIIAPAKNHKHDLTKVPQTPATCLEEGNIEYYFCTGCNDCFTDAEAKNKIPETMSVKVGALGHTTSDTWGIDETYHWRICTTCKQVLDETKMQHDVTEDKCTTCNYVIGDRVTNPETTPAETTPEPGHNAEQSNNTWIKILLVALVCFAAAITVTVIILKKKKK